MAAFAGSLPDVPYTLSHPAFAVPLRRLGLPATALAIGSLTPDVPLWADAIGGGAVLETIGLTYAFTHSRTGVLTACLAFGLALWAWWLVVRAPLYDALPKRWLTGASGATLSSSRGMEAKEPGVVGGRRRPTGAPVRWFAAVAGLWIGAASHALVDELTHEGRWAHSNVAWFAQEHAGLAGVKWVQYVGSIGGALIVAGYVLWWLRARRRVAEEGAAASGTDSFVGRPAMRAGVAAGIAGAAIVALSAIAAEPFSHAVFRALSAGVRVGAAGATIGAVAWHVSRGTRRPFNSAPRVS